MKTKTIAALALLAVTVAACSGETTPGAMEGRWILESATDAQGEIPTDTPDRLTVVFDDGHITGRLHCNTITGTYRSNSSGRFELVDGAVTDMACADLDLMEAEQRLAAALGDATRFRVSEGTLTLEGEGVRLVYLADTADPGTSVPTGGDPDDPVSSSAPGVTNRWFPPETYGEWELERGILDGDEIPIVAGFPITLSITDRGFGGKVCNAYGFVPNDEDPDAFPDIFSTMMLCTPEEVMDSEARYHDALRRFESARVESGKLVIEGDGAQLVYRPVG